MMTFWLFLWRFNFWSCAFCPHHIYSVMNSAKFFTSNIFVKRFGLRNSFSTDNMRFNAYSWRLTSKWQPIIGYPTKKHSFNRKSDFFVDGEEIFCEEHFIASCTIALFIRINDVKYLTELEMETVKSKERKMWISREFRKQENSLKIKRRTSLCIRSAYTHTKKLYYIFYNKKTHTMNEFNSSFTSFFNPCFHSLSVIFIVCIAWLPKHKKEL